MAYHCQAQGWWQGYSNSVSGQLGQNVLSLYKRPSILAALIRVKWGAETVVLSDEAPGPMRQHHQESISTACSHVPFPNDPSQKPWRWVQVIWSKLGARAIALRSVH